MKPYKSVSIRVPKDLHEQFTATCRDLNRSFNAYVIEAMQDICNRLKGGPSAFPGTDMKLVNTDYSALEKRIMAHMDKHFDRVEKKMDNPVYHIQIPELSAACNVDLEAVQRMMGDMRTNTAHGPASMKLDTSGITAADLEEFSKQLADGRLRKFEPDTEMPEVEYRSLRMDGAASRALAWARGKADLPIGDVYAGGAEKLTRAAHAAVYWKRQLEYWKGCTCVRSIPVDCTSQELVEYYERNCTTCGRNYKHLETGEQE